MRMLETIAFKHWRAFVLISLSLDAEFEMQFVADKWPEDTMDRKRQM